MFGYGVNQNLAAFLVFLASSIAQGEQTMRVRSRQAGSLVRISYVTRQYHDTSQKQNRVYGSCWRLFMRMALRLVPLVASIVALNLADATPTNGTDKDKEKDSHQVVVDAVVTDSNNQPVRGLRRQDFQVFEGNKLQQIRSFEVHDQEAATGTPKSPKLPENTFSNASASEMGPINIILLDQMTTSIEDQKLAKQELVAYLDQKPPGSLFAIFTYRRHRDTLCIPCDGLRMLQGITGDKELLIGALEGRGAQPEEPTLRALAGWEIEDTSMNALAEIGNFLRELPGRKQLIWLSDNFDAAPVAERGDIWFPAKFKGWQRVDPLSKEQTLHLAASRLAIARVAVYPIDLNGRNKRIESKRLCEKNLPLIGFELYTQSEEDTMYYECTGAEGIRLDNMARKSGGQAFHHRGGIREAIAQTVAEGENYYTLSYSPTKIRFDGKLRTIRVAINRKEYQVRFRQHYFADDPSTVYRPGTEPSPDILLAGTSITTPWRVGRVSSSDLSGPDGPIAAGMRYGGPELDDVIFEAHVTAKDRPMKATEEQLKQLETYESFRDESAERAMWNLTKEELKTQHHGQTLLSSLPPPDQLYLQGFSIDYSIAASELVSTTTADSKLAVNLEIAVLAFDERGKRVTGTKDTISFTVLAAQLEGLQASGFRLQQTFDVPERASVLRIAVRDVSRNKVGSVEIPIWAISNPYQRRRLDIPVVAKDPERQKKSRHAHQSKF
jgi:VWFA-related protein